jgi:cholesterol transport system auxiliary component
MAGVEGCSLLGPQDVPSTATYTLSMAKVRETPMPDQKITLLVNTPTASAGYDSRKMIYTKKRYELSDFARNQWAATPAEMLEPILIQKLRNTGYFHAVIHNDNLVSRRLILRTHLIELQQDFTVTPSQIKLALQAELINVIENKVINTHTFTCSMPARENTPYSGVLAANRAVDKLLSQIAEFCVRSIKSEVHNDPPEGHFKSFSTTPTTSTTIKAPSPKIKRTHPSL